MIIDCHFHVWPDVIARKALGQPAGDLVRFGDGTRDGAIATMDAAGIDRAVALGVGNTPDRVESANTFVGELQDEFAAIVHVGHGGEGSGRCTPAMLAGLVRQFPRLDLIACHFGGYRLLDQAEDLIIGLPVYVDTSWPPGIGSVDRDRVKRMIERHGPDRVIYGSDWPMADPAADVRAIRDLGLSDADTDAVLGGNLARIVGLS